MAGESSRTDSSKMQPGHSLSVAYWEKVPATIDGMLGGYPQVSRVDLRGSLNFLAKLRRAASSSPAGSRSPLPMLPRGVDCGAGVGRVTAGFLSRVCSTVDIVEPVAKFASQAEGLSGDALAGEGRVGKVFVCPLQDWDPVAAAQGRGGVEPYDLIWNQWCVGHLTDAALVAYLRRCCSALRAGGWIVVKENVAGWVRPEGDVEELMGEGDIYDELENSVTRTDKSFRRIFEEAGLNIVRTETQSGFPKALGLYPVRFYALQPKG